MAPPNPIVALVIQRVNQWNQTHAPNQRIDLPAELAVASQEGLSGRIGDNGHAFGPNQENDAGGVLTGRFNNWTPQQKQSWALSPAGIDDALRGIAAVAGGLHGQQAVNAIVTQFERPANPGREVAGANQAYGRYSGSAPSPLTPTQSAAIPGAALPPPVRPSGRSNTLAILNEGARMFGLPPILSQPSSPYSSAPLRLPTAGPVAPSSQAPVSPTPLKVKGPTLPWLEHQAAPFGLTVTSTTGGKHSPRSYHYQGRAIDLAGPPSNMAAAANYALQHPGMFSEMFYSGPGHPNYFISGGKVYPLSQLSPELYREHENHVHWAR